MPIYPNELSHFRRYTGNMYVKPSDKNLVIRFPILFVFSMFWEVIPTPTEEIFFDRIGH